MKQKCLLWVGLLSLVFLLPRATEARRAERKFRGKVIITKKRPPAQFRTEVAFVSWLNRNKKKSIWPDKKNKKRWTFEFMAFFRQALDDLEVKIRFLDITRGRKFIAADTFYIPKRGERTLASKMILERPDFAMNRKYLMQVVSPRGALLASSVFYLRGQAERYSGKVNFSEEEARLE